MGKFDDILYPKRRLFDFFNKASSYVPSTGLIAMGTAIAHDYGVTGRLDLLVGGSMLALLGAGIADITNGNNFMARTFNKIVSPLKKKEVLSQGEILTYLGIGSCAVLGGGEAITYAFGQDVHSLQHFLHSSSLPKIVANLAPYMAVSLLEVPSIFKAVNKKISGDQILNFKFAANLVGGGLIINFAQKANLPIYETLGMLQIATTLGGRLLVFKD